MDLNDIWIHAPIINVEKSADIIKALKQKLEMGNEISKKMYKGHDLMKAQK